MHLCMAIPKDFTSAPTIGVRKISWSGVICWVIIIIINGLWYFEFKPSFYWGATWEMPTDWRAADSMHHESLPRTTMAKLMALLEMPHRDPKVQLAAELGLNARTHQEQSPGAHVCVPRWERAQSGGCRSQCQLGNGKLASTNKAKAYTKNKSLVPDMSSKTTFHVRTAVPLELSQKGSQNSRDETARNNLQK